MPNIGDTKTEVKVMGRDKVANLVEEYRKLVYDEEEEESVPAIYKILLTAAGFVATEISILIAGVSLASTAPDIRNENELIYYGNLEANDYLNDFPSGHAYALVEYEFRYEYVRDSFHDIDTRWVLKSVETTKKKSYDLN